MRRFAVATLCLLAGFGTAVAQLPAGHPVIPDTAPAPADGLKQAIDQGPKGILAIRAVQGTKGGPEPAGDEVEIIFLHRDTPVQQVKAQLDEHGLAMVPDVPVSLGLTPLVRVKHGGVLYQDAGKTMDAANPNVSLDVLVFETTEQEPAWNVEVRNVMASEIPGVKDKIAVGEVVVVDNPSDQTWLGAPADAQNRRATVSLTLAPGATEIVLQAGFHGWCCTEQSGQRLVVQMPLMPGRHTYKFAYRVPIVQGKTDLRVANPAPAASSAFLVPTAAMIEPPTVVTEAAPDPNVDGRMFEASKVPAGQSVGIVLTGWEDEAGEMPSGTGGTPAYVWILVGAGAVVVGLVAWRKFAGRG